MTADWIDQRYTGGDYSEQNPTWDSEDSPWKATQIQRLLSRHHLPARTIAEVGCGAGGVLARLRDTWPDAELHGYDIAPALTKFWARHQQQRISFQLGDFLAINRRKYDLVLLLDVVEHLENPFDFLTRIREHADYFVLHFPLDLSAATVFRETPLLAVRAKVGHLHFFTKGLALALLAECGYVVVEAAYTGASLNAPRRSWKTRLASGARRIAYAANKDAGVRLLGGETLMVLARPAGTNETADPRP